MNHNIVDLDFFRQAKKSKLDLKKQENDKKWSENFRQIMQKNLDLEAKVREQRKSLNKKVLKSYRLV